MNSPKVQRIRIPSGAHTIFSFRIPYAIPIPDGIYKVKMGEKIVEVALKRIQKNLQMVKLEADQIAQFEFDKYGRSSFSFVQMKFPYAMDLEEVGRRPLLLKDAAPRNKAKETVLRCLNHFIEAVRFITEAYWMETVRYQDISEYDVSFWDGKNRYPATKWFLDSGAGALKIGVGPPFPIEEEKMKRLGEILLNKSYIESSEIYLLNSKDACLLEDFRLAIIEGVVALEITLYMFIRKQGGKLGIPRARLNSLIKEIGLSGNISVVLKMLTQGLEQVDNETLKKCVGAIKIRNKILHEGLKDVSPKDTEEQIIAIEEMTRYLKKLLTVI